MEEKLRQMEDEMNRFEAEIGGQVVPAMMRPVIGANTYSQVAGQLEQHEIPTPAVAVAAASLAYPPMMGKGKKNKKIIRMAGGQTWEDPWLLDLDDDYIRSTIEWCRQNFLI